MLKQGGQRIWVLIVAEDDVLRNILGEQVVSLGYSVIKSRGVKEALHRIDRLEYYDVVIVGGESHGLKLYNSVDQIWQKKLICATGGLGEGFAKTGQPVLENPHTLDRLMNSIEAVIAKSG